MLGLIYVKNKRKSAVWDANESRWSVIGIRTTNHTAVNVTIWCRLCVPDSVSGFVLRRCIARPQRPRSTPFRRWATSISLNGSLFLCTHNCRVERLRKTIIIIFKRVLQWSLYIIVYIIEMESIILKYGDCRLPQWIMWVVGYWVAAHSLVPITRINVNMRLN